MSCSVPVYSPFHQEDPRHQAMCNQDTHTRKVVVAKRSPQALIEATDSVVRICRTLAIWYAVEEVTVVCPLLPHSLHFGRAWLEVAKVLFSQTRLFEDGYLVPRERRWCRVVGREGAQDAFGGFARSAIGRGKELERVVRLEQRSELFACLLCLHCKRQSGLVSRVKGGMFEFKTHLSPAMLSKFHPVVWYELMDVAVLVSFRLSMPNQYDHLDCAQ